jgi:SAM-dependent methyltransferase
MSSDPSPDAAARQPGRLVRVIAGQDCCDPTWEAAYQRFETPEEEIRKFQKRLHWFGAEQWPRDARIAELFCGRGNGLVALERLGFSRLEGVDLSESLLRQYQGPANCYVADCRQLPWESGSKEIVIVQGGVHHLPRLPDDLQQVLAETSRVLVPGGLFVLVEPWLTPFLRVVHAAMGVGLVRRAWSRLDALAIMTEREATTYFAWLSKPQMVRAAIDERFSPRRAAARWGKLYFLGQKR